MWAQSDHAAGARDGALDEGRGERLRRRAITGPALLIVTPIYLALTPVLVLVAGVADAARRRPWTAIRFTVALAVNLVMHVVGFAAVFGAWLVGGRWAGADPARERRLMNRVQVWWASVVWAASVRVFSMRLVVSGRDAAIPGPVVVLARHASIIDTLLPLVILGNLGLRLRYVMKRELLRDPLIDALGHRWPHAFIRRGTRDPHQIEHVARLLDDLGATDAVVLYPEGTRFTPDKRAKILASLRTAHPEAYARARRLRNLLPPHPAGSLTLLARPDAPDVVLFAHTGLERANHFKDLLAGSLVGATVEVAMWRVSRADIPRTEDAALSWLEDQWERIDCWIDAHRARNGRRSGDGGASSDATRSATVPTAPATAGDRPQPISNPPPSMA